jgi:type IV secretion system protein VirD4
VSDSPIFGAWAALVRHFLPTLADQLGDKQAALIVGMLLVCAVGLVIYGWLTWALRNDTGQQHGPLAVRWASGRDLAGLLWKAIPPTGLLLGRADRQWVAITPNARGETGNLLVVGPPRSGKGLLATTQLLTWQGSAFVSDPKGELFAATAGWRATLGPVYVLSPRGRGHRLDPIGIRQGAGALRQASTALMGDGLDEGHGAAFTQRATTVLMTLFQAARQEDLPALPYVGWCLDHGLEATAERLEALRPEWHELLVGRSKEPRGFLLDSWESIRGRLGAIVDSDVVSMFGGSDFLPADLYQQPATVYLTIPERDMEGFTGLVRLLWETFIGECLDWRDAHPNDQVQPILALVDEAGITPIPVLPRRANTVNGRGVSLWVAVQSLAQLDGSYGRSGAYALREGMHSHVFYRPADMVTATHLEERVGRTIVQTHTRSQTRHPGSWSPTTTDGIGERETPLLLAQDALQLPEDRVIAFTAGCPPMLLQRTDWRQDAMLSALQGQPVPALPAVPALPSIDPTPPAAAEPESLLQGVD